MRSRRSFWIASRIWLHLVYLQAAIPVPCLLSTLSWLGIATRGWSVSERTLAFLIGVHGIRRAASARSTLPRRIRRKRGGRWTTSCQISTKTPTLARDPGVEELKLVG